MHSDHASRRNRFRDRFLLLAMVPLVLQLAACGAGSNKDDLSEDRNGLDDPNRFLEYFDPQADLAGGEYTVKAKRAGMTGTQGFTLEIDLSNGEFIVRNGQWTSGQTSVSYGIDLAEFGGAIIRLESSADNSLSVEHAHSATTVAETTDGGPGDAVSLTLLASEIDSTLYAKAYYEAVDPQRKRRTLADWKKASGFNDCDPSNLVEVKFRDTKDLGYGRHMRACTQTQDGGYAYFVDNYQVDPIPEIAYSALNLEAVLKEDIDWNIGTNAIEFSPPVDSTGAVQQDFFGNDVMIAKFFTFEPRSAGSDGQRDLKLRADLDSRGNKAMPMICVQCHGGRLLPLNPDGTFPRLRTDDNLGVPGGVEAKLQALEVDTFEFPESGPYSRANQEEKLRKINKSVYDSYTDTDPRGDYGDSGEWDPTFLRVLLDGWYGGDGDDTNGAEGITQVGAVFDQSFVPPEWEPDPISGSPPVGADDLFREVVSPRCIVCHGKRGSDLEDDINFSSYDKFISHASQMEELIFDEGIMPAARVEFEALWEGGQSDDEPSLIGSFLPGFSHGNADGSVDKPGSAHADAGPDRTISGLPATLSGEDSFFAGSYKWELVSAPGGGVSITNSASSRATLSGTPAATPVTYDVRLTVTDNSGREDSDEVSITVDAAMEIDGKPVPKPRELRFDHHDDVTPILDVRYILQIGTGIGPFVCTDCHSDGGNATYGGTGIPMWWSDSTDQATSGKATSNLPDLYDRAMTRVNLRDPNTSLILRKPSGNHHNGGVIGGFDLSGSHLAYDMFYTWIVEGAPR